MMFISNIAIAITNNKNAPYREYGSTKITNLSRKSEVILPFDTEYKIYAKNNTNTRIKLSIDIDGSIITDGFVINANSNFYLDRFLDSDKRFLFVRKNNEAVADPSNKENGFLTVKVEKEKEVDIFSLLWKQPYTYYQFPTYYPYQPYTPINPYQPYWYSNVQGYCASGPLSSDLDRKDSTLNDGHSVNYVHTIFPGEENKPLSSSITYCSSSIGSANPSSCQAAFMSFNSASPIPETGATIEGSRSDQVFSTTDWNGTSEEPLIFVFKMLGKDSKISAKDEADLQEYKRLKAKFEGK